MVKTPAAGNRNPGSLAKRITGGGEGSAKHVKREHVGGSPNTRKVSVDATSNIGRMVGNHIMERGGNTVQRPATPLYKEAKAATPMGNELAKNVGRGGVGTGRTNYGQAGTQSQYGKPNPGIPTPSGELFPGWPAKPK
jgi:hypothetical protein